MVEILALVLEQVPTYIYILNLETGLSLYLNPQSPSVDEINLMVSHWKIMSAVGLFIYI